MLAKNIIHNKQTSACLRLKNSVIYKISQLKDCGVVWATALLFMLLGINLQSTAQSYRFSGKVVDGLTGQGIPGATLSAEDSSGAFAITDDQGLFNIFASSPRLSFAVLCLGYHPQTVLLDADSTAVISLRASAYELKAVEIVLEKEVEVGLKSMSRMSIDQATLSRHSTAGLGEVLSQMDGVSFISTGTNIQLPVIHGLYGNRILMLNNGFRHGFQNWGRDHAPEMDISGAERVELVKGAAGVKYGPDALGGAVLVHNSELTRERPLYLRATTTYQTNGRGYGGNVAMGEGGKHFSYHLGANYMRIGDRHAPRYMLTNTGAETYALQGGLAYRKGPWTAQAHYSYVNQDLGILRASIGSSGPALIRNMEAETPTFVKPFSYDINEPNQLVSHQLASASLSRQLDNGRLNLRYARQWNTRREFDVRRNADLPVLDLELTTDDLQLEWEHSLSANTRGSWGLQVFAQANSNNPGTLVTPFIPNYASQRWSAYLIESLRTGSGTWELGLRYDHELNRVSGRDNRQNIFRDRFTFGNFTASIGKVSEVNERVTWRNNLGSGWRPPNMAELFSFGQHESQTTFGLLRYEPAAEGGITASRVIPFAESDVAPEHSVKYTSELEWSKEGKRLNVTAYANYIRNFIFSRPIGVLGTARGPMPTFIIDQADGLFLGTDLTYTLAFRKNGEATMGASYIYTRNVRRDEPLIFQPPIHLHLRVLQSFEGVWGFDKITCSLQPSYTFRQFQAPRTIPVRELVEGTASLSIDDPIFDFMDPPPGYFLLHAMLQLQKGRFGLGIEARNALNNSYRDYLNNMRYFADELGTNLLFSLSYHL